MIEKLKQNKLVLIIFIMAILLIITGVTYSFYKIKLEGQKTHFISSDLISFTYKESENKISITNMTPVSDIDGKKGNYFEFSVLSKLIKDMSVDYVISLTTTSTTNSFEESDIKLYLTDENDNELISPVSIGLLEENPRITNSKVVYANSFTYNEKEQKHTYRIRVWSKDNVDMSKYVTKTETENGTNVTLEQHTYKFKINVNTIDSLDTSGANKPILASNMIPVYYNGSTVTKADYNNGYTIFTYKLGDVNGNGRIDRTDAVILSRCINNILDFNMFKLFNLASDIDGDGKVTENDLLILQRYLANWPDYQTFPAGEPLEERTGITSNRWYSYESSGNYKGMWANAVTVTSDKLEEYKNAEAGTTISMDDITTMWVWIPRFNAVTPSNYNGGTKESPGAIDVTFVKENETAIDAFTFGDKELSGFWYGKFEVSHSTLASSETDNNLGCTNETCSNANGIIIKPNVTSLSNNNVSNFFYAARSMEQIGNSFGFVSAEVDTHMSKNNEWGAVAYLTQSIYGRCTNSTTCSEVGINNNGSFITGYGAPAGSSSSVTNGAYNTTLGKDASTTGTIYGIYDMSGGANEYVMGVATDSNGNPRSGFNAPLNSGFTGMLYDDTMYTGIAFPESKYYNLYTGNLYTGHALTEIQGWYSDVFKFVSSGGAWLLRGGSYYFENSAGIFYYGGDHGGPETSLNSDSSRIVITNE